MCNTVDVHLAKTPHHSCSPHVGIRGRKWFGLIWLGLTSAVLVLMLAASASAVTIIVGTAVSTYDWTSNANIVDKSATGIPVTLATFKTNVSTAFTNNLGGVLDFTTGNTLTANNSGLGGIAPNFWGCTYAGGTKTLLVQNPSGQAFSLANDPASTLLSVQCTALSDNSVILASAGSLNYNFTFSSNEWVAGEGIVEFGFTVLSRFIASGTTSRTIFPSYNGVEAAGFTASFISSKGGDDTFFSFKAPAGQTITGIRINQNVGTAAGRPALDDWGFITSAPEINVTGNGNNIPSGSTTINGTGVGEINTSFGTVITGAAAVTNTFTVQDTGLINLTISSPASITGGAPFSVSTALPGTVAASGSSPLGVQMATGTVGNFTRTVSVPSNDADENPYTFNVAGTVLDHSKGEFRGQGLGDAVSQVLSNNDQDLAIDFGTVAVGAGGGQLESFFDIFAEVTTASFTADLELLSITGGGAGFTLPAGPGSFTGLSALAAGGNSADYTAELDTTTPGVFSVVYTFNMFDDQDYVSLGATGHTLTLTLTGEVVASASAVPEPSTFVLAALGLVGLGFVALRKRYRRA